MYARGQLRGLPRLRGEFLNIIIQELNWREFADTSVVDDYCMLYMLLGKILRENV